MTKSQKAPAPEPAKANARLNMRRRERYGGDPEYRAAVTARNTAAYRERTGAALVPCRDHLAIIEGFGKERELEQGGTALTFTATEVADVLKVSKADVVRRWIADGRLPDMPVSAIDYVPARNTVRKAVVKVYMLAQMKAIAEVMADHRDNHAYYRANHTETKELIFAKFSSAH
ncbi:hypothetical protein H10PHJ05_82 [Aeromonas phage HJ05]|nr:hypothetical protein H10PHJ05_82 [Aeromonas phage HJ05]